MSHYGEEYGDIVAAIPAEGTADLMPITDRQHADRANTDRPWRSAVLILILLMARDVSHDQIPPRCKYRSDRTMVGSSACRQRRKLLSETKRRGADALLIG